MITDIRPRCEHQWKYPLENCTTCMAKRIAELEAQLKSITAVVDDQAEDTGLWFVAQTASEAYLQQALRDLHGITESLVEQSDE